MLPFLARSRTTHTVFLKNLNQLSVLEADTRLPTLEAWKSGELVIA